MSELQVTHESTVTEDQIDHLGHMNVRFYAINAHAGTTAVLASLPGWDARGFVVHDVYTRHHREQLLGTRLVVRSALVGAEPGAIRVFHELAAADSGVLAATFVHGISPLDGDGLRRPVPADLVEVLREAAVPLPPQGATRTIVLGGDLLATTPTLATVQGRDLAMRKPREVRSEECDERGRYRVEMAPMLTWAGEPTDNEPAEILHTTDEGVRMGWAAMETRVQIARLPALGDRVQSFGAAVSLHDKVTHRVYWSYDLDRGDLLTAFESVSMAFDIDARRPISIPSDYRQREQGRLQPDLAPQVVSSNP